MCTESLIIYLKPYRHRCISRGKVISDNGAEYTELYDEGLYNDYDNSVELNYLNKIWFEIITQDEEGKEKHVGYITGYYINMDDLDIGYGVNHESFYEFDNNSHLTMELWHYLQKSEIGHLHYNYYFMNNITLDKEYNLKQVEAAAIDLIRSALYEIYRYEVSTIIYSAYRTELDDDTFDENEVDELKYNRHIKNLLEMDFKWFTDEEKKIYLYKDYMTNRQIF